MPGGKVTKIQGVVGRGRIKEQKLHWGPRTQKGSQEDRWKWSALHLNIWSLKSAGKHEAVKEFHKREVREKNMLA